MTRGSFRFSVFSVQCAVCGVRCSVFGEVSFRAVRLFRGCADSEFRIPHSELRPPHSAFDLTIKDRFTNDFFGGGGSVERESDPHVSQ